jgi:hypothetical protein
MFDVALLANLIVGIVFATGVCGGFSEVAQWSNSFSH